MEVSTALLFKRECVTNHFNEISLSLRVPLACVHPESGDRTLSIYLPSHPPTSLPLIQTHKTASDINHHKDRGEQQNKHMHEKPVSLCKQSVADMKLIIDSMVISGYAVS